MVLSHRKLMLETKLGSSGRAANILNKGILSPVLCLDPTYPGLNVRDVSVDTSDQYTQAKVPRNFLRSADQKRENLTRQNLSDMFNSATVV